MPCPSVRNYPCDSVVPLFSPIGPRRVPTVTEGPSGTHPGTPSHLRDRTWVLRTERVPSVGFRSLSGGPLPLSCSLNFPLQLHRIPFFGTATKRVPAVTEGPTGKRPGPSRTAGTERRAHTQSGSPPWCFVVPPGPPSHGLRSQLFKSTPSGPFFAARSQVGSCWHRRVVGDVARAPPAPQGPDVDPTHSAGVTRGVSSFSGGHLPLSFSRNLPLEIHRVSFFAAPTPLGSLLSRKGCRDAARTATASQGPNMSSHT